MQNLSARATSVQCDPVIDSGPLLVVPLFAGDDMALALCCCSAAGAIWSPRCIALQTRLSLSIVSGLEYAPASHFCFLAEGLGRTCGF